MIKQIKGPKEIPIRAKHPTPRPLTEKEKAVLEFIEINLAETGVSPSYQEIRDHFGFASFNSVQNYLKQLSQKGYVQIATNQKRAIQVLAPSHAVESAMQRIVQTKKIKEPSRALAAEHSGHREEVLNLPLLGRVAAGLPIEEFEHDETVDVPPSLVRNPQKTFALKVKGSSMIEDGIHDGDIILVQKQSSASNGEIVVASVENESTVKRYYLQSKPGEHGGEKMIELRPSNSTMNSMWYQLNEVNIQGVLVGLIRKF